MTGAPVASRATVAEEKPVAATLLVLLAASVSVVVYRDVLDAYFFSDDFVLLYLLRDLSVPEFLLTPYGEHTVVGRNAVFALTHLVAGLDPRPYFETVLATHAVNVALLGLVVWRFTRSATLAGAGALVWGICPAAGDSLSWYAAYAQVAATTFLLLAIARLARSAGERDALPGRELAIATLWLGVSLLFFGSALAVAAVWPVVIVLLFPGTARDRRRLRAVVAAAAAVIVLYGALQVVARTAYATPDVSSRALSLLVAHPRPGLVAFFQLARVGVASLALGAWWRPEVRSDLVSWLTLLLSALAWLGAFAAVDGRTRRTLTACTLVALAIYALTAVARAPGVSQLLGWTAARLAASLRYHYAPQAFLVVAGCTAVSYFCSRRAAGLRAAVPIAWAVLLLGGVALRGVPVDVHQAARSAVAKALGEIQAQVEATPRGETAYVWNQPVYGFGWMPNTTSPLPGLLGLFVIVSPSDEIDGRPVRFVESAPAVVELVQQRGGRLARLLVVPPPGGDPAPFSP